MAATYTSPVKKAIYRGANIGYKGEYECPGGTSPVKKVTGVLMAVIRVSA